MKNYELNPDTIEDILTIFSYFEASPVMLSTFKLESFEKMENPGVQVNIIYAGMLPTLSKVFFDKDPRSETLQNRFAEPDKIETQMGDGTVLVSSAISPGIKWAWEYQKNFPGAKPVKFIELCSEFDQRNFVYDDFQAKKVKENSYFGIDCGCRSPSLFQSSGSGCEHTSLVSDSKLLKFLIGSIQSNEFGKIGPKFSTMSEAELKNYIAECQLL